MTAPYTIAGDPELGRWHEVMRLAAARFREDPTNPTAMAALTAARSYIQNWVRERRSADQVRSTAEMNTAQTVSTPAAFAAGASHGATFGLGDELGAAVLAAPNLATPAMMSVSPGLAPAPARTAPRTTESARQAYLRRRDELRAFNAQAQASHPYAYVGGEIAGSVPAGMGASGAMGAVAPALPRAVRAGATAGAQASTKIAGAAAAGGQAAAISSLYGYGVGDEGPVADLAQVPPSAGIGFMFGFPLAYYGSSLARRSQVGAAKERSAVMEPAQRQSYIEANEARTEMYRARTPQRPETTPAQSTPATPAMHPAEAELRRVLARQGFNPANIERAVEVARQQGRFGVQAPIETPTAAPTSQAPSTQRTARPEPGITSSEVAQDMEAGRAGLRAQRNTPVPEGPVEVPAILQPNGATFAHSRGEAARSAYAQTLAATGDEAQAAAAARHVAGQATNAIPAANSPDVLGILASGPTEEARATVLGLLRNSSPQQQQLIATQLRSHPLWAAWLRQVGLAQ